MHNTAPALRLALAALAPQRHHCCSHCHLALLVLTRHVLSAQGCGSVGALFLLLVLPAIVARVLMRGDGPSPVAAGGPEGVGE